MTVQAYSVKDVQKALAKAGFDPGPIDGDMGKMTRAAVRAFQKANKLTADGIVGPVTAAVLGVQKPSPVVKAKDVNGALSGKATRPIHTLVWHCTATPRGKEFTREQIEAMHIARGFTMIGYHYLVHLDGKVEIGRPESMVGAHVSGHNTGTLGASYVGGVEADGKTPADTRTEAQKDSMAALTVRLLERYPSIRAVVGHRDLSPDKDHDGVVEPWEWVKHCPCFNAIPEYGALIGRV